MYKVERVDPAKTALIVVDMENDFVVEGAPMAPPDALRILENLQRVIETCRAHGIPVIYTTHVHRSNRCDMGLLSHAPWLGTGESLVDGSEGIEIYPDIAPRADEIVIKKHRFSAFFGTDLEIVLRGMGITTVAITGVTSENCCHATARDAFFRDFEVMFLSDATATSDYPDLGYGSMSAADVHRATLVVLARDTADVVSSETFISRIDTRDGATREAQREEREAVLAR